MNRTTVLEGLIDRLGGRIERQAVSAGTVTTAYLAAGAGPHVLLLHGAGAAGIHWGPVMGALSAFFRVIAPDIVGHGESDKPSALYDRPYFCGWLRHFLDALGVGKSTLVGHSLGGAIALQFALDHPARVHRLVLVDAAGFSELRRVPLGVLIATLWSSIYPSRTASLWLGRHALLHPERVDEALADYAREVGRTPGARRVTRQGRGRAQAPISAERLVQITQETLIIWGEADRFFPSSVAEFAARAIPHAQLHIIREAGHVPYLDQPGEFNDVLLRFLKA